MTSSVEFNQLRTDARKTHMTHIISTRQKKNRNEKSNCSGALKTERFKTARFIAPFTAPA